MAERANGQISASVRPGIQAPHARDVSNNDNKIFSGDSSHRSGFQAGPELNNR